VGNVTAMSTLMQKLTELAQSPQGKKLADRAQQFANDPKTKAHVEKAKLKLAEIRAGAGSGGAASGGSGGASHDTPDGPPKAA
jgi:hypothetical protein